MEYTNYSCSCGRSGCPYCGSRAVHTVPVVAYTPREQHAHVSVRVVAPQPRREVIVVRPRPQPQRAVVVVQPQPQREVMVVRAQPHRHVVSEPVIYFHR